MGLRLYNVGGDDEYEREEEEEEDKSHDGDDTDDDDDYDNDNDDSHSQAERPASDGCLSEAARLKPRTPPGRCSPSRQAVNATTAPRSLWCRPRSPGPPPSSGPPEAAKDLRTPVRRRTATRNRRSGP